MATLSLDATSERKNDDARLGRERAGTNVTPSIRETSLSLQMDG